MAREVKERDICGQRYRVTLLGAKAGIAMSVRLLRLIGPTLASFVEGTVHGRDGAESIAIGAADAMRELVKHVNADDLAAISSELAKFTIVVIDAEHEPRLDQIFDDHFAGRYDALSGWLSFAIEANFASFFGGGASVREVLARVRTVIESLSKSQPRSTGQSGASPAVDTSARA